jgi:hypothetical protein
VRVSRSSADECVQIAIGGSSAHWQIRMPLALALDPPLSQDEEQRDEERPWKRHGKDRPEPGPRHAEAGCLDDEEDDDGDAQDEQVDRDRGRGGVREDVVEERATIDVSGCETDPHQTAQRQ